ncbi:hypothetical protein COCNU_scaffold026313G000010 [Cocos nucifera]|nr:hypothetical protein [Cocos nucifera]
MIQVVEEFKVSSEMMDLNIAFIQETFQKGYKLCDDRLARKFLELDLAFLYGDVSVEQTGPSVVMTDPCPTEAFLEPSEPSVKVPEPMPEPEVVPKAQGSPTAPSESAEPALESASATGVPSSSPVSPPKSLVNADLLPQGIPLRAHLKYLRKEVHQLKKKLKKTEDELQKFREHASKATIEVIHLYKLHMRDSASVAIRKGVFKKEFVELKKNTSNKSWGLTVKISSLEVGVKEYPSLSRSFVPLRVRWSDPKSSSLIAIILDRARSQSRLQP